MASIKENPDLLVKDEFLYEISLRGYDVPSNTGCANENDTICLRCHMADNATGRVLEMASREAIIEEDPSMNTLYRHFMDKDNLADSWMMFSSPLPMATVVVLYLATVIWGPRLMEGRPAFRMDGLMRIYNLGQVAYNGLLLYGIFSRAGIVSYVIKFSCSVEGDENLGDLKKAYLHLSWHYMLLKMLDLIDTAFLILKKKNSHVSFLHVYHHGGMVLFCWITFKFSKSPHAAVPGIINIFVHAVMYCYYFLATFPALKPYLWWKQLLTKLQLTQFILILLYILVVVYNGCPISRMFTYIWSFNVFVILVLFLNFYIQAYIVKPKEKVKSR